MIHRSAHVNAENSVGIIVHFLVRAHEQVVGCLVTHPLWRLHSPVPLGKRHGLVRAFAPECSSGNIKAVELQCRSTCLLRRLSLQHAHMLQDVQAERQDAQVLRIHILEHVSQGIGQDGRMVRVGARKRINHEWEQDNCQLLVQPHQPLNSLQNVHGLASDEVSDEGADPGQRRRHRARVPIVDVGQLRWNIKRNVARLVELENGRWGNGNHVSLGRLEKLAGQVLRNGT
ncbi:hypothetical protein BCR44DRAFT_1428023 [Catenaria anguillulae PL171]|uniref:Uncharacterized protein n=1 Tax=Catenaria anguillulae PL171 TaxID=765915 RepID=A0A1Y2HYU5_9FUNG|nr:hypothetical protein BCR44DRAFT_1428023 [Catenaria anguillulae PL171]